MSAETLKSNNCNETYLITVCPLLFQVIEKYLLKRTKKQCSSGTFSPLSTFAIDQRISKMRINLFNFSLSIECSHSARNFQAEGTDLCCYSLPVLSYINI